MLVSATLTSLLTSRFKDWVCARRSHLRCIGRWRRRRPAVLCREHTIEVIVESGAIIGVLGAARVSAAASTAAAASPATSSAAARAVAAV